jgi:hypothetical protein
VELDALTLPAGLIVDQWNDLRERYEGALRDGNERTRERAERLLKQLDEQANREGAAAEEFRERLEDIDAWVQRRKNDSPPPSP